MDEGVKEYNFIIASLFLLLHSLRWLPRDKPWTYIIVLAVYLFVWALITAALFRKFKK